MTQPREHSVPCRICTRPTWSVDAVCARHVNDREALDAVNAAHERLEIASAMQRHPSGKRIPPGP